MPRRFSVSAFCAVILALGAASFIAHAQTEEKNPKVVRIDVQGNQVVSTSTVLNNMKTRPGVELNQQMINEDIKRLYGTNFFQDIRMDVEETAEGVRLIVRVDEKPVVRRIAIEGNRVLKERQLRKDLNVIEGQVLDEFAIKQGVNKIRERYSNKGFRFATVKHRVDTERAAKEAVVTIVIEEGAPFRIHQVVFEGVQSFKFRQLRKVMKTKARNLRLLRRGIFREDRFKDDLDRLNSFYQSHGYLDVRLSHEVAHDEQNKKIVVKIQVEEGKQYQTGKLEVKGVSLVPESEIWQKLEMLPGLTFSQQHLAEEIQTIRNFYFDHGHMDVQILPEVELNRETGKADVTYQIKEGDIYFVDKVKIRGNTKTKDVVIRRELRIRPGDKFEGSLLKRSKERLENLGFFEEVSYDTEPSAVPNRRDIVWKVKEKRTGELSFGAGISSIDQFLGFGEIAQRNFDVTNWPRLTGGGQSVSLRGRWGTITRDFEFNFVEPYLFNQPVSWGLDAYHTRSENRNVDFREERFGFGNTISKAFTDFIRAGAGYRLERVKLFDISEDAFEDVRLFEGRNWLSRAKLFINRDTRNNVFFPTKGWVAGLSGELVGTFLGGEQDYYILQANSTKYWSFFQNKHVLEGRIRLGVADEAGSDQVPVFDRFFAGGYGTVRGFNYRRVGPIERGSAIGGNTMAIANLEYTYSIPYLDNFKGAAFVDAGNVERKSYRVRFGDVQMSVGPGIKINTPIGPLAFYYGFPIVNRDTEDKFGRFEFSLSRSF